MFRQRAESSRRVGELLLEAGSVVPVPTATGAKSHPPSMEGTGRRRPCPDTGRITRPSGCADVCQLSCAGTGHRRGYAALCAHSVLRTRAPEGAVPAPRPLWPLSLPPPSCHHLLVVSPSPAPGPCYMGSDPPGHHVDKPCTSRLTLRNSVLEVKYIFFSQRYLNLCFQMLVSNVDFDILFREKKPEGSRTPPFLFRTFSRVLVLPESMRTVTEQDG